ncbi:DM13 domain-containing protein [Thermomonospora umbrina]|uniref:Electron transfer DM13 n=1 Tax=Thermomonospora umbrina TaxID=111806 RepID=A0A3D9SNW4_9ACTN|nr:DM13 domain-containing protein [Thermomonospora umbrina]REE97629.1 electron transfer DM13 [Thermomonospora umbrina]
MVALLRKPVVWVLLVVLAVAGAVALVLFQPWLLFVDEKVNEAGPPGIEAPAVPGQSPQGGQPQSGQPQAARPQVVSTGSFISHEHGTSGTAKVIRLADGKHVLRLENLDTSNGPDLRVWLSDQPVKGGTGGWFVFDDGAYVELGKLKGNKGNQNYEIPASADLGKLKSVTIWCKRFHVSFGAAALNA